MIHIEQQWQDNALTALGSAMHARVHDEELREKRGDTITVRGLAVHSRSLMLTGYCDAVEFRKDPGGHPLAGEDGLWLPVPIEYKRGRTKASNVDRLQLCAQAICLEEMLACDIETAYLFYGATRSRERVPLTSSLRDEVLKLTREMHEIYQRGYTPKAKITKSCNACSLSGMCLPGLSNKKTVRSYINSELSGRRS